MIDAFNEWLRAQSSQVQTVVLLLIPLALAAAFGLISGAVKRLRWAHQDWRDRRSLAQWGRDYLAAKRAERYRQIEADAVFGTVTRDWLDMPYTYVVAKIGGQRYEQAWYRGEMDNPPARAVKRYQKVKAKLVDRLVSMVEAGLLSLAPSDVSLEPVKLYRSRYGAAVEAYLQGSKDGWEAARSFDWEDSPQGADFWSAYFNGRLGQQARRRAQYILHKSVEEADKRDAPASVVSIPAGKRVQAFLRDAYKINADILDCLAPPPAPTATRVDHGVEAKADLLAKTEGPRWSSEPAKIRHLHGRDCGPGDVVVAEPGYADKAFSLYAVTDSGRRLHVVFGAKGDRIPLGAFRFAFELGGKVPGDGDGHEYVAWPKRLKNASGDQYNLRKYKCSEWPLATFHVLFGEDVERGGDSLVRVEDEQGVVVYAV